MKKIYAIFGGNFDPIHYGHIHIAETLIQKISIEKLIFLPNNNPPHRNKTKTSIIDKINMIKLAIQNYPSFHVSDLEAKGTSFFFTIDTLKKIRKKIGFLHSLFLIIGEDNLQNFYLWKNWKTILLYSHLLIFPRKHEKKNHYELKKWIKNNITNDYNLLCNKPFGFIFFFNTNLINISSSQIRHNYYTGKSSLKLLPPIVNQYIMLKKLYCY